MKVLLDENFPLGLLRRLRADGLEADHIIPLGLRGAPDSRIRLLLQEPSLFFLTQDEDFLFGPPIAARIVVSRVRQARPLHERIDVWVQAIQGLARAGRSGKIFELTDAGLLVPWRGR